MTSSGDPQQELWDRRAEGSPGFIVTMLSGLEQFYVNIDECCFMKGKCRIQGTVKIRL